MDKISVIIPVYKVEKYLNECLESVVNQTYQNLEIILVDDGSPDNCPKMCDEWAQKDQRIKVIHKQNGGLSDARNAGLDILTGKYFTFIDSDDKVDLSYIQELKNGIDSTGADLSIVFNVRFKDGKINTLELDGKTEELTQSQAMYKLVYFYGGFVPAWGKLYLAEKYKDHKFLVGKINEDEFYANEIFHRTEKVCFINKALYFYRINEEGIMNRPFSLAKLSELETLEYRDAFLVEHGYNNLLYMNRLWVMTKIMALYYACKRVGFNLEAKNLLVKFKNWYKIINKKDFSKKYRMRFWVFKRSPKLCKIFNKLFG